MAEGEQNNTIDFGASRVRIKPTTGLPEGTIKVPPEEGVFSRARRVLSRVAEKLDTNKENIPPKGKAF